jgi:hypothetical protein
VIAHTPLKFKLRTKPGGPGMSQLTGAIRMFKQSLQYLLKSWVHFVVVNWVPRLMAEPVSLKGIGSFSFL